jgi:predicted porin
MKSLDTTNNSRASYLYTRVTSVKLQALLNLALLLMPFAVKAELSLYGSIDLSFYYNAVSRSANALGGAVNASQAGITSGVLSGSRWGIKGSDTIGDGWSSGFVLESGINAQEGTLGQGGLGFGRQATVSIMNQELGTLDIGRKGTFSYLYMVPIDPFSLSGSQAGAGSSFGSANGLRLNNLITYETPTIQGFQAGVGYSFSTGLSAIYADGPTLQEQAATNRFSTRGNMRGFTAALRYNKGPLSLLLTYDAVYGADQVIDKNDKTVPNNVKAAPNAWILAGSYDFKLLKLAGAIGQTRNGLFLGQSAGAGGYQSPLQTSSADANVIFSARTRVNSYLLSATIPVRGTDKLLLSWQGMLPRGVLEEESQLSNQLILSAAYIHQLSKRTDLYLWGSYGNNYQSFSTAKSSVIGTGIRHLF